MFYKEKLERDRVNANVGLLKLKQLYSADDDAVYLIVEGKDDVAYYTSAFKKYRQFSSIRTINSNNRANVITIYKSLDWEVFSKNRVLFFVDRDLSDIIEEFTPDDMNVYVTDCYSIENSLFDEDLLQVVLKVFYGVDSLSKVDQETINDMFIASRNNFENSFLPVMALILCCRANNISCNLSNLDVKKYFVINHGVFEIKDEYKNTNVLINAICSVCNIINCDMDLELYTQKILEYGGIHKYIRGKFVCSFFLKFLDSILQYLEHLGLNYKAKQIVTIGSKNAIQVMCGYMRVPDSLHAFISTIASA